MNHLDKGFHYLPYLVPRESPVNTGLYKICLKATYREGKKYVSRMAEFKNSIETWKLTACNFVDKVISSSMCLKMMNILREITTGF